MSSDGDDYDVLVFGSCIVDFISYVPRLPKVGETLHGTRFATGNGGKGANQCVAAARLGSRTAFFGKLGDDPWGAAYRTALAAEGVNVEQVDLLPGESTGIAQINVADNGDNQIVIVTGANKRLAPVDAFRRPELFVRARVLVCQLETPIDGTIAAMQSFRGISILNAAPADTNLPRVILSLPSIFCVNETEAALIAGMPSVADVQQAKVATRKLQTMGCKTVIVTLGEKGAVFARALDDNGDGQVYHVKPLKVDKVVDTTGAGDAFIGALAHCLANYPDAKLGNCIAAANRVAAWSVQIPGTQSSFPRADEIELPADLATLQDQWGCV
ncbi:AGAP002608-PA [Anopheles gambiae str. PEST]|uniref:Ribokinase n=1 Tax=Anopheles gambiae TaxID=7165 RepID=Q7QCF9_ANOGA|nr:ribokinase isoform X2 [Anopheles gambiae]XP_061508777.1 ribokinase isoform X2 [Anopheles gambiae]EAA08069.5 AGAP002608-PA [Anopheles gambiae str. PEST]